MNQQQSLCVVFAVSILLLFSFGLTRAEDGPAKDNISVKDADSTASGAAQANENANNALGGLDFDEEGTEQTSDSSNKPGARNPGEVANTPVSVIPMSQHSTGSSDQRHVVPTAFTQQFFRTVKERDRRAQKRMVVESFSPTNTGRSAADSNADDHNTNGDIPAIQGVPVLNSSTHSTPRERTSLNPEQGATYRYLKHNTDDVNPSNANDIFRLVYDGAKTSREILKSKGVGTSGVLGIKSMQDRHPKGFVRTDSRISRLSKIQDVPSPAISANGDSEKKPVNSRLADLKNTVTVMLEKGVRMEFPADMLQRAELSDESLANIEDRLLQSRTGEELESAVNLSTEQILKTVSSAFETRRLDAITAVSIKHLCEQSELYRDRWAELPDTLRYPGQLRRIFGYVLIPDTKDLIVLGSQEGECKPLDIDDLIIGFNCVWAEGKSPVCSLDPDPSGFGGPQWVRIEGVPMQTGFALAMLEADYDMKKLFLGTIRVNVPGFVNNPEAFSQQPEFFELKGASRFWFRPADLPQGSIRVSPSSHVAIFDSIVMVDTQIMNTRFSQSASPDSLGRHPIDVATTGFVNSRFGEFERELPSFAHLHALFDVALLAKILHEKQPDNLLLKRFVKLPTRETFVRSTYPGITAPVEAQGRMLGSLSGGVNMSHEIRQDMIVKVFDPRIEQFTKRLDFTHISSTFDDADLELPKTADRATSAEVSNAIQPASPSINLGRLHFRRAIIYHRAELYWLAERELNIARSHGALLIYCDELELLIRYDRGDLPDTDNLTSRQRGNLINALVTMRPDSYDYLNQRLADNTLLQKLIPQTESWDGFDTLTLRRTRASLLVQLNRFPEALRELDEVIKQQPNNYRTLWVRSLVYSHLNRDQEAYKDANDAVRFAGKNAAACYYTQRALSLLEVDNTASEQLESDFRQAVTLEPRNPDAHMLWARYLAFEGDIDGAISACSKAIRYGNQPEAYYTRAALLLRGSRPILEDPKFDDDGMKDLNFAIQLDPISWEARQLRGDLVASIASSIQQVGSDANLKLYTIRLFEAYENAPLEGEFIHRAKTLALAGDARSAFLSISTIISASVELCAWDYEQAAKHAPEHWKNVLLEQAAKHRKIYQNMLEIQEKP